MNIELNDSFINDDELQKQIDDQLKELEDIKIEASQIGDPKKLADSISQIIWEQFVIQIAGQAGEEFIKQNNNLNLSLKSADHILNEQSFSEGKLPSHNAKNLQKYQQRYQTHSNNFLKDENGNIVTHKTRMGTEEATLTKNARYVFDKDRPSGSKINHTDMDHTISAGEILRDQTSATYLDESEKVKLANSEANLNEIPSDWNKSKSDYATKDWLDTPNANGQKPRDIFNMSNEDEQCLLEKDAIARKEYEQLKEKGKERAIQEGKESIKKEALTSLSYTAQAVAVALLAKLTRTVFQELVKWLAEKDRKVKTFLEHLKKAIKDFLTDFKNNVLLSVDVGVTVLLTQIFGEIVPTIKKALLFIKIGGESVYKVFEYLKNPENAYKETSVKTLEIGKIVTVSLTTAGAVGLGIAITAAITHYIPVMATVNIPLLGSPAGLLGIFFGGLTAGICGAIVLNIIEGALEGKLLSENISRQLITQGNVLELQDAQFSFEVDQVNKASQHSANTVRQDLLLGTEEMQKMRDSLNEDRKTENDDRLDSMLSSIDEIE